MQHNVLRQANTSALAERQMVRERCAGISGVVLAASPVAAALPEFSQTMRESACSHPVRVDDGKAVASFRQFQMPIALNMEVFRR